MVDNQGTDTSQNANELFDESIFTDTPQEQNVESSIEDNTLTPSDAFTEPSGEEAPKEAPSTQEPTQPLEAKNDENRYQYWQSQAAQKDNQIRQMQEALQQQQQPMQQQPQPEVPGIKEEEFPPPPERPVKPRNFNRQEAYEDSSSESAKYLDEIDDWRDTMDEWNSLKMQYDSAVVQERVDKIEAEKQRAQRVREAQYQQASQLKQIDGLMQGNYGMSADESKEFITQMSDPKSISIDNLVKLYRLQKGQGGGAPVNSGQPAEPSPSFQQAQRAQQVPQPMGVQPTAGNNQAPAEDQIMDNIISDYKKNNPW